MFLPMRNIKEIFTCYDSERDSFMIALKALGYSMNTTDLGEIQEAYEWLINQRDTMDPIYAGDDVIDNMISGNKAMAVVYSGDASYIISENPDLDYYTPKQGTNTWYDAMVITKDCNEVDLAHEFINFMLDDEKCSFQYRRSRIYFYCKECVRGDEKRNL